MYTVKRVNAEFKEIVSNGLNLVSTMILTYYGALPGRSLVNMKKLRMLSQFHSLPGI